MSLIPTTDNIKTVSDLRKNPLGLLRVVEKTGEPQYIFYRSTPKAVLLKISEYIELIKNRTDYYDSLMAQRFEKEDKKKTQWLTQKGFEEEIGF